MSHTDHTATPADDAAATHPPGSCGLAAWRGFCALPLAAIALLLPTLAAADPPHARRAEARAAQAGDEAARPPYTRLHVFHMQGDSGNPATKLTVGPDGYLYGLTREGGANDRGTAYRTGVSGETTTFHHFNGASPYHLQPTGAPVFGSDGAIYGMSYLKPPTYPRPSIYRLTVDGRIHRLAKLPKTISQQSGDLIRARDGYFYGTSAGKVECGVYVFCRNDHIFRFNEAGRFTILHKLTSAEGEAPMGVVEGNDGNFYGLTSAGGAANKGVAYKVTPDGAVTVLHEFKGAPRDGQMPSGALVLAPNGLFYGVTRYGGQHNEGAVFSMDTAGQVSVVHSFERVFDRTHPTGGLTLGPDGYLYGVTSIPTGSQAGAAYRVSTAGAFELLHQFGSSADDGRSPYAGMTVGPDGLMYGVTHGGGAHGMGTVYQRTAAGEFQAIHAFDPERQIDGYIPRAGVLFASDGHMYGTTFNGNVYRVTAQNEFKTLHEAHEEDGIQFMGDLIEMAPGVLLGTAQAGGAQNQGTVFKMATQDGTITVLHAFSGQDGDGAAPQSGLVKALDGHFYGTTYRGGTHQAGTIYRVSPDGDVKVIWSFTGTPEVGALPIGPLALGPDGALYGVTKGGLYQPQGGVYKITTQAEFTPLHQFDYVGGTGIYPSAGLVLASNGLFYGVTEDGPIGYIGSVFSISPAGEFQTRYRFSSLGALGYGPVASLTQASDGFLYGTTGTSSPDPYAGGSIFRMTLDGAASLVHDLRERDGGYPKARMVQGPDGALYGTTSLGGTRSAAGAIGRGVLFRLDIGALARRPAAAAQ